MTKEPEQLTDLAGIHKRLSQAGVQHGDLLFMHYPFERTVAPVVKKTIFDGALRKMTVEQLIAKQTRIERWDSSVWEGRPCSAMCPQQAGPWQGMTVHNRYENSAACRRWLWSSSLPNSPSSKGIKSFDLLSGRVDQQVL